METESSIPPMQFMSLVRCLRHLLKALHSSSGPKKWLLTYDFRAESCGWIAALCQTSEQGVWCVLEHSALCKQVSILPVNSPSAMKDHIYFSFANHSLYSRRQGPSARNWGGSLARSTHDDWSQASGHADYESDFYWGAFLAHSLHWFASHLLALSTGGYLSWDVSVEPTGHCCMNYKPNFSFCTTVFFFLSPSYSDLSKNGIKFLINYNSY